MSLRVYALMNQACVCVSGMVYGARAVRGGVRMRWSGRNELEWALEWVWWMWISLSLHSCRLNTKHARTVSEAQHVVKHKRSPQRRQRTAQHTIHFTTAHTHTHINTLHSRTKWFEQKHFWLTGVTQTYRKYHTHPKQYTNTHLTAISLLADNVQQQC